MGLIDQLDKKRRRLLPKEDPLGSLNRQMMGPTRKITRAIGREWKNTNPELRDTIKYLLLMGVLGALVFIMRAAQSP